MSEPQKYKEDFFSAAVEPPDLTPVLVTVADNRQEAEELAQRQLDDLLKVAAESKKIVPFDPAAVQLFSKQEFLLRIGPDLAQSDTFRIWYAYSRLGYLRRRMDWEFDGVHRAMSFVGPVTTVASLVVEAMERLDRAWWNLDHMLERTIRFPEEVDHDPGPECFTCDFLAKCSKGQEYLLAHSQQSARPTPLN